MKKSKNRILIVCVMMMFAAACTSLLLIRQDTNTSVSAAENTAATEAEIVITVETEAAEKEESVKEDSEKEESEKEESEKEESDASGSEYTVPARSDLSDYQLDKMVIFSRHNMRAPTTSAAELMAELSPNEWTDYTAPNGELTLLGGTQETAMGQYFRQYLIDKGMIENNWIPEEGQVRIYANSYQRTVATANYFVAGMFPVANVDVEYHEELGTMDEVFKPAMHFISDAYLEQIQEEMDALADGAGMQGVIAQYADDLAVLEETLDFAESSYAKENNVTSIPMEDSAITYELGEEPAVTGGLKTANSAADALVMQYYAEPDLLKASFGHELTWDQWHSIGNINTMYLNLAFGLPSVAVNVVHPLLEELESEMTDETRVFSYLCGHDSDVLPLMVALGVEDFDIVGNICEGTPIGCKLVLEKYRGTDGQDYAVFSLLYQDSESLRNNELVTLNDPPIWVELTLSGLEKNEDGLYLWDDVVGRFDEAIEAYDELPEDEAAAA